MTRVHHPHPQHAAQRSMALDQPRAVVKKKKPYKIVLEAVTQEKKKLHSILTYASNAPKGFGFVPAGHPEFTEWCKEQCRQRNLDVHIVSAKPKNKMHTDPEKLSHHVHRIGHHFPLEIINLACTKFGYIYDEAKGLKKDNSREGTNWIAQRVEDYSARQALHGRPTTQKEDKEHTRGAVREMFPKIPEADLHSIVNHAFEEGTNRVGNAKELSLARRVQLAVVAHIRHMYTDYDKILKAGTWTEARQKVEHVSLAKLKEWRDEAGDSSNEIEDTFREVIVLDDDDESSDEGSLSTPDEREQSMEIVSSRATARDLQPERYTDYPRMDVHAMRRVPRRTIVVQPYPSPQSAHLPAPLRRQPVVQPNPAHTGPLLPPYGYHPSTQVEPFHVAHNRPTISRIRAPDSQSVPRSPQPLMQEIEGQMYHLQPVTEAHDPPRLRHAPPPRYAQTGYVPPQPHFISFNRPATHSRRTSEQDVVIPSVERETADLASPRRTATSQPSHPGHRPISQGYAELQPPTRKAFSSFPDDRGNHVEAGAKRPRLVYYGDEKPPRVAPTQPVVQAHSSDYLSMDLRNRPRAQPPQEVVDLTSSPRRPPTNEDRGQFASLHTFPTTGPSGHQYIPVASRRSPPREERGTHYEVIAGEPPRVYMPDNGMYETRAPPARDYLPKRYERPQQLVENEGIQYLRSRIN